MQSAPTQSDPSDRILNWEFFKLFLALFGFLVNLSIINSLLPYYLELRGASPELYGRVSGVMGLATIAALLVLGRMADRWNRKASVLGYAFLALAGNLAAIWAHGRIAMEWYYLPRVFHGVFLALGFPLLFTWAVEMGPPHRRQEILAWLGMAGLFANALGPTLGEGILKWYAHEDPAQGYLMVFQLAAVAQLWCMAWFAMARNSPLDLSRNSGKEGLFFLLKQREVRWLLLTTIGFGCLYGTLLSFSKNYAAELGLDFASILFWGYAGGAILSRLFIRQVTDFFGIARLVALCLGGLALVMLTLTLATGYPHLLLAGLLYGVSHGLLYPSLYVLVLNRATRAQTGRAATLFQGAFTASVGSFPLVAGIIINVTGFVPFYQLATGFSLLLLVMFMVVKPASLARGPA